VLLDFKPTYLFLLQFKLFRFQELSWYADWTVLRAYHEIPQLFAESRGVLVQEASELNLNLFDLRLLEVRSGDKVLLSLVSRIGSAR
jgi:hypothetical protein